MSEYIFDEFARNARDKFVVPAGEIESVIKFLRGITEVVEPASISVPSCPSKDLPIIGTAVAGRAHILVTGDAKLIAIRNVQSIQIASPRQFYEDRAK